MIVSLNDIHNKPKFKRLVSIVTDNLLIKGKIYTGFESDKDTFITEYSGRFIFNNRSYFLTQKEYREIRLKNLLEVL